MKCLVCKKELVSDSTKCSFCGYVNPLVIEDSAKVIAQLKNDIESHRTDFFSGIKAGLVGCYWNNNGQAIVLDHKEDIVFGTLKQAYNKIIWLPNKFDNVSKRASVQVVAFLTNNGKRREYNLTVPNTLSGDTLSMGFSIDDECRFSLVVKDASDKTLSSKARYAFE